MPINGLNFMDKVRDWDNGGVRGVSNTPTSSAAPGIFNMRAQNKHIEDGNWPDFLPIDFIEYVVVDDSETITIPATIAGGELAVMIDAFVDQNNSTSFVTPTGWTTIGDFNYNNVDFTYCVLSYKVLVSGDASATVTGMAVGDQDTGKIIALFDLKGKSTVTVQDYEEQGTNGDPTAHTVGASASSVDCIVLGAMGESTGAATAFTGSDTFDGTQFTGGTKGRAGVGYKIFEAGTSIDFTVDMADIQEQVLMSCYLEIT